MHQPAPHPQATVHCTAQASHKVEKLRPSGLRTQPDCVLYSTKTQSQRCLLEISLSNNGVVRSPGDDEGADTREHMTLLMPHNDKHKVVGA
jgi:hypothetical protein